MRIARRLLEKAAAASLVVVLCSAVFAPQGRGQLRGLVTDELGAAIVGASVTLTDAGASQKKTTTNAEGVYSFAGLTPGKYSLEVAAPGFANSGGREVTVTG